MTPSIKKPYKTAKMDVTGICEVELLIAHFETNQALPEISIETFSKSNHI
jgi:hypothetical protein